MASTILVVDDSYSMRWAVKTKLQEYSYQTIEAESAEQALEKIKELENPVDMVITDLNMKEMDGIDLVREIRKNSNYKFTPIIMLTTQKRDDLIKEAKQAGATGWMVKPVDPPKLLKTMKKLGVNP